MATKKKPTLTTLRNKLWDLTSKYVRISAADSNGNAMCVTCGAVKRWQEQQAGHFVPQARGNAVRFDLRNIHPQCPRCNIFLGGNLLEYYPFMVEAYGQETVDELKALSHTTVKFTRADYLSMIDDMSKKLAELVMGEVRQSEHTVWALQNIS